MDHAVVEKDIRDAPALRYIDKNTTRGTCRGVGSCEHAVSEEHLIHGHIRRRLNKHGVDSALAVDVRDVGMIKVRVDTSEHEFGVEIRNLRVGNVRAAAAGRNKDRGTARWCIRIGCLAVNALAESAVGRVVPDPCSLGLP